MRLPTLRERMLATVVLPLSANFAITVHLDLMGGPAPISTALWGLGAQVALSLVGAALMEFWAALHFGRPWTLACPAAPSGKEFSHSNTP